MNATGAAGPHVRLISGRCAGGRRTAWPSSAACRSPAPGRDLRLAAPMPVEPWKGVREAVAFGPPPPQSGMMGAPPPATPTATG